MKMILSQNGGRLGNPFFLNYTIPAYDEHAPSNHCPYIENFIESSTENFLGVFQKTRLTHFFSITKSYNYLHLSELIFLTISVAVIVGIIKDLGHWVLCFYNVFNTQYFINFISMPVFRAIDLLFLGKKRSFTSSFPEIEHSKVIL